ncbi:MAG: hypothetical protein HYV26_19985 [Candidatus Hydrogenedentes bacterium]|nr:hypothetical protein [Candidatus Hydrogenedentota bacterium]
MSSTQYPEAGDPRQIVRWARRYAKSRTISFMVQWLLMVCLLLGIWIAASLTHTAYLAHNYGLVTASAAAMSLFALVLVWFSVSRWGGEFIWRITMWLYGEEGYVEYTSNARGASAQWWLTVLGAGMVIYHLLGALLITFGSLAIEHMQPFSACYMVPFLVVLILVQRLGFWAWIWPVLYAMHAVLVAVGAPIVFPRHLELLNMALPVFGYGLVAILVGHAYSRFALWRLKRLTRSGLPPAGTAQQAGE